MFFLKRPARVWWLAILLGAAFSCVAVDVVFSLEAARVAKLVVALIAVLANQKVWATREKVEAPVGFDASFRRFQLALYGVMAGSVLAFLIFFSLGRQSWIFYTAGAVLIIAPWSHFELIATRFERATQVHWDR